MPDLKISQLPPASTPLAGTELVPIVQGGVTDQTTVQAILTGTVPSGTANGVLYLNGSKVVTSGSGLTFDGTTFVLPSGNVSIGASASGRVLEIFNGDAVNLQRLRLTTSGTDGVIQVTRNSGTVPNLIFQQDASELMRLTSTGLGIGTSSPAYKLDVAGSARFTNAEFIYFNNSSGTAKTVLGYFSDNNTYLDSPDGATIFRTGSGPGERMRLDSSGNLGLGVTPSAWGSNFKAIQGFSSSQFGLVASTNSVAIGTNYYHNNTDYLYATTGQSASRYDMTSAGVHRWFTAPSGTTGTAGNVISFTQALTLDANRNLLLNGTAAPASGVGTLAIFNGTAPTGSVTNGIVLYAEDVSSSSELKVRDEAGNVTTLSPHNFELIPEGPSEDMAWSYYSERDGKRINVDMLKAIRLLEKLSGEQLVYEA
jgi:hypothetical protein